MPEMRIYGTQNLKKFGMVESSVVNSAELFSKTSEMVPNGLDIPMYMYEQLRIQRDIFPVMTFFLGNIDLFDFN